MYIRITSFSYDPEREDEFIAIADATRDEMKLIEGLQSVRVVRVADLLVQRPRNLLFFRFYNRFLA